MSLLEQPLWSPYITGACIGILSWLTFLLSDRAIGCSTAFAQFGGMIERLFRGNRVMAKPYFRKTIPEFGWETMLIFGIVLGALTASTLSGTFSFSWVPALWQSVFGPDVWRRLLAAFAGGIAMGFGARWAGGCTSGHGISGTLQLAVSGWLAVVCFFAGGIVTAFLIFGR